MSTLVIPDLDSTMEASLRGRADSHGRTMEDEARQILREALVQTPAKSFDLLAAIRERFGPLGGVELPEIRREPPRDPPTFDP